MSKSKQANITYDELCNMNMLEEVEIEGWKSESYVQRVPGGWIFITFTSPYGGPKVTSVFIPLDTKDQAGI